MFRNITGNVATAWGLLAAAERSGRKLFLGSYPITPASEILQELAKMKHLDAIAFQGEDEIAGICASIGASFTGRLGVTTTSGPGLALKGEGIGLAVITELPLVVVNVQRGGPSTGLPTKTEQSDLLQALYGRHGESPCIVMAASSPADCFDYAYEAARLAIEHMTPVILLTDGYLANGSELWQIPKVSDLPAIIPPLVEDNDPYYHPYNRDPQRLARYWAFPGQEGLRHRIGGLEKTDVTGEVSHDPMNHEIMTLTRAEKVERVANRIPKQKVVGKISLTQFNYINPLPDNVDEIFSNFKKILVCELNLGQFAYHLRSKFPKYNYLQFNKIQGLPFLISELKAKFIEILEE